MATLELDPKQIADRANALGRSPHAPSLAESVLRGIIGFTIVSVAGFAPWALGGRVLHHAVGEIGMYAACALVFVALSGLLLHRLIIGPGSVVRFYLLFTAAFMSYAACWTVAWMVLRGNLGSLVGLLLGTAVMAWMLVRAFDALGDFLKVAAALFALNAIGYFAGGWAEAGIARLKTIHIFGLTVDHRSTLSIAMLSWGVCYGIGFGAGLGLAFYFCQANARALLPPVPLTTMKAKWWFTILLGLTYLAVFNLWRTVGPPWIAISGVAVSAFLGAIFIIAAKQRYFFNFWDGVFHASVILDIVLEATLIKGHEHVGFYLCAAAFAVVLVGYRLWWLRRRSNDPNRTIR
jgi:hypothetical protein